MIRSWLFACVLGSAPWQWIITAPRTGTVIEIEDRFGLLSERRLERWDSSHWIQIAPTPDQDSGPLPSLDDRPCVYWRPFFGSPATYAPHNPSDADKILPMRHPQKLSACTTQDAGTEP